MKLDNDRDVPYPNFDRETMEQDFSPSKTVKRTNRRQKSLLIVAALLMACFLLFRLFGDGVETGLALTLGILIVASALFAFGFWKLRNRWLRLAYATTPLFLIGLFVVFFWPNIKRTILYWRLSQYATVEIDYRQRDQRGAWHKYDDVYVPAWATRLTGGAFFTEIQSVIFKAGTRVPESEIELLQSETTIRYVSFSEADFSAEEIIAIARQLKPGQIQISGKRLDEESLFKLTEIKHPGRWSILGGEFSQETLQQFVDRFQLPISLTYMPLNPDDSVNYTAWRQFQTTLTLPPPKTNNESNGQEAETEGPVDTD